MLDDAARKLGEKPAREMTLHEAAALAAMQGMLSCRDFMNDACRRLGSEEMARDLIASYATKQADSLVNYLALSANGGGL